jgi:glycosyltransferase involved in cell wall biosynthesis
MELSVIVPCHNVADTLSHQLAALVEQEWDADWEIVVVDNASSDETRSIAERYASRTARLRIEPAFEGRGVGYARNAGVRATSSVGIAICDGDDIVEPGWVRTMGEALRGWEFVTGSIDLCSLNPAALAASRGTASADELPHFGCVPFARGNNCGMRRDVFERLGGYDESFIGLEDIEFSLRAAATGIPVHFEPGARIQYRYRDDVAGLWRQGRFYGASVPALAVRARRLGLEPPSRLRGLKSWAWLLVHALKLVHPDSRLAWLWVLANRIGSLEGSVRARSLYV